MKLPYSWPIITEGDWSGLTRGIRDMWSRISDAFNTLAQADVSGLHTDDIVQFGGIGLGGAGAANKVKIYGATSGSVTLGVPAVAGSNTITFPAGTTDFSATGGATQILKQSTAGGAITVGQLAATDLSGVLGVLHGGTGSDLSATGGASRVLRQSSAGAAVTVSQLGASDINRGARVIAGQFNPTGTANVAYTMMGLGAGGFTFTPTQTGTVLIKAAGYILHSAASIVPIHLNWGTGTPPANGVAEVGSGNIFTTALSPGGNHASFSVFWMPSGLTLNTTYWGDLAINTNGAGGTASVNFVEMAAIEL